MLRKAAGRSVALDGRTWRTIVPLLLRPGFLTREYFAGRRRRHIGPGRLFLVASIALFAVLRFRAARTLWVTQKAARPTPSRTKPPLTRHKGTARECRAESHAAARPRHGSLAGSSAAAGRAVQPAAPLGEGRPDRCRHKALGAFAALILLPLFALLLKVLYLGRARRYPDRPQR